MPQLTAFRPNRSLQASETCSNCPNFQNFYDERSRGWCSHFDQVTRTHHPRTATCNATIGVPSHRACPVGNLAGVARKVQSHQSVMVELITHELDIDPEDGFTSPKDEQTIKIDVPKIFRQVVEQVIASHQKFTGYYVARFWKPEEDEF
ncbi:MAG: hypothetical protein AAGF26_11175 [Cyanobacteria bacterium P01_G01_bin.49]